eukprot:TRINITY_DN1095_c0_g2_i1.p1 TRINITY_DN1095_c0_g2~~TRINITY_DN1095_c0_g2_i1.p1  ORF type:complete len:444 (+),score=21.90 TRINITY_DN1095_c0_g2_i1:80-1411(+)
MPASFAVAGQPPAFALLPDPPGSMVQSSSVAYARVMVAQPASAPAFPTSAVPAPFAAPSVYVPPHQLQVSTSTQAQHVPAALFESSSAQVPRALPVVATVFQATTSLPPVTTVTTATLVSPSLSPTRSQENASSPKPVCSSANAVGAVQSKWERAPIPAEGFAARDRTVYGVSIDSSLSERDLVSCLSSFGPLVKARLCGNTNNRTVYGFFEFQTKDAAQAIVDNERVQLGRYHAFFSWAKSKIRDKRTEKGTRMLDVSLAEAPAEELSVSTNAECNTSASRPFSAWASAVSSAPTSIRSPSLVDCQVVSTSRSDSPSTSCHSQGGAVVACVDPTGLSKVEVPAPPKVQPPPAATSWAPTSIGHSSSSASLPSPRSWTDEDCEVESCLSAAVMWRRRAASCPATPTNPEEPLHSAARRFGAWAARSYVPARCLTPDPSWTSRL